jgi:DNA-binding phage protein
MSNTSAAAAAASGEPIVYIILIAVAAGLVSGVAAYLTQPVRTDPAQPALPQTPWYTFCLLGLIAAACVPLFLSVVESSLMSDILSRGDKMVQSLLIFLGLCLLTALTARAFLDSLSRRILQQMEEIRERQDQAALDRSNIRADVHATRERIEVVEDVVEDDQAPAAAEASAAEVGMLAAEALPDVDAEERRLIQALGQKGYRTVSGVAEDSGLSRDEVKKGLAALAVKGVATATNSPRTGGVRWMLTPPGRALHRAAAG